MRRAKFFLGIVFACGVSVAAAVIAACVSDSNNTPVVVESDGGASEAASTSTPDGSSPGDASTPQADGAPPVMTCTVPPSPPPRFIANVANADNLLRLVPINPTAVAIVALTNVTGTSYVNVWMINPTEDSGATALGTFQLPNRGVWIGLVGGDLGVASAGQYTPSAGGTAFGITMTTFSATSLAANTYAPTQYTYAQLANATMVTEISTRVTSPANQDFFVAGDVTNASQNDGELVTAHFTNANIATNASGTLGTQPTTTEVDVGRSEITSQDLLTQGADVFVFYSVESTSPSPAVQKYLYTTGKVDGTGATSLPNDYVVGAGAPVSPTFIDLHGNLTDLTTASLYIGQSSDPTKLAASEATFAPLPVAVTDIFSNGVSNDSRIWAFGTDVPFWFAVVPNQTFNTIGLYWFDAQGNKRAVSPVSPAEGTPLITGGYAIAAAVTLAETPSLAHTIPLAWMTELPDGSTASNDIYYSSIQCE